MKFISEAATNLLHILPVNRLSFPRHVIPVILDFWHRKYNNKCLFTSQYSLPAQRIWLILIILSSILSISLIGLLTFVLYAKVLTFNVYLNIVQNRCPGKSDGETMYPGIFNLIIAKMCSLIPILLNLFWSFFLVKGGFLFIRTWEFPWLRRVPPSSA